MKFLVSMPRETDTSIFTSRVTQGTFLILCVIGFIFIALVFIQNYKDWSNRKNKTYDNEALRTQVLKSANHDFMVSSFISIVVVAIFIIIAIASGRGFFR